MLLRPSFRLSSRVAWTGATRCRMVCRRTRRGRCSSCRTLLLVRSPAYSVETTSLRLRVNSMAVGTETSGIQDCMSGTPIAYLSADIHLVSGVSAKQGYFPLQSRHLCSSSYRTLAVPRTRTTLGDRSFANAGPRVWNSLTATIRQITSYGHEQFRQHLQTHLFRAY